MYDLTQAISSHTKSPSEHKHISTHTMYKKSFWYQIANSNNQFNKNLYFLWFLIWLYYNLNLNTTYTYNEYNIDYNQGNFTALWVTHDELNIGWEKKYKKKTHE